MTTPAEAFGATTMVTCARTMRRLISSARRDRIADDDAPPLQAFDPRLHGGAREAEPPRRLRMADAGVLAQKGDQGAVGGIEHHIVQSEWQYAEN